MPEPVADSGTEGVSAIAGSEARQGSSMHVGSSHVLSALQVAVPDGDQPNSQVTGILEPVAVIGANGIAPLAGSVAGQETSATQACRGGSGSPATCRDKLSVSKDVL